LYNISRKNVTFETIDKCDHKEISWNSAFSSNDKNVDNGKALLFQGKSNESLVFVHGLGHRNFEYLKYYPINLSKSGYTTMMLVLPYHLDRMPQNENISFLSGTASDIEKRFYQSVVDTLTCVDYLENLGMKKIHIMGFSFGGMISTISLALDKRIDKGILVVTGGNFEYITWKSIATKVLRIRYEDEDSCNIERCHELHKKFDISARSFSCIEDLENLPSCFRYDPSLFAKDLNPNKILMFSAIFDPFIPQKSSKDLWNKMNKPKRYKLPSGHMTSHLWFKKFILNKTLEFVNYNQL
jgi:esterase/lipase